MNKEAADKCIYEYRDKIFGFAMKQTRNVDQANELASDILCEVYRSFRRADAIANLDGYVYRIAQNVWARYARSLVESRRLVSIDGAAIPYEAEPDTDEREMFEKLRREIGYLSERQRQVVYLHYYRECSVSEIAARLKIAAGTVKWHLSDARIKLKEGITMTNSEQTLGINPIRFVRMGHWGNPGATGDTSHMFDTRLKQNIAYACYWQPKTLEEIARELGVPQVYLADDLKKLVEYAYVDSLDNTKNPKYQTNMMIEDMRKGSPTDDLMDGAAKYLCERYFPDVFRQFEADPEHWGFVCDGNDVNFMKYTLLMLCLIFFRSLTKKVDSSVFHVKRPDGGILSLRRGRGRM